MDRVFMILKQIEIKVKKKKKKEILDVPVGNILFI